MAWVEFSGKTIEEAKETAAQELGIPVDQLEVELVDEGSKGLLGLGQAPVRIRVAVSGDGGEAPVEEQPMEEAGAPSGMSSKAECAMGLLQQVLPAMEFDAQPRLVSETEEEISIELTGSSDDIGRLIGRHGQTLDALQYLLALSINKQDMEKVRVVLDAEGYRERHKQALEAKAREYARGVKETGNEAVLEPQSPRDRRIVHMALVDDPDVITYSEGQGDDRHVVISPKS